MIYSTAIFLLSTAALGRGDYPTLEVVAAFKSVCDLKGNEGAIVESIVAAGWKQSPPEINMRVGKELWQLSQANRPASQGLIFSQDSVVVKFARGFVRTVSGEQLALIVSNVTTGGKNATACVVIDEGEQRKPSKKSLQASIGRKISGENIFPGFAAWQWVPGLSDAHQGIEISYSNADGRLAKMTGFSGLRFRTVIPSNYSEKAATE